MNTNMSINFSKIVTCNAISKLGEERFNQLEKMGKEERNIFNLAHPLVTYKDCQSTEKSYLPKKALEIAFKSSKYMDLSKTEKLVLDTAIIYPDTYSFAEYLNKEFSLDDLENIVSILENYKKLALRYKYLNQDFNPDLTIVEPFLQRLQLIYGKANPNHDGINKVNGILVYQKTLLK
ncbi:MAG: hypothetical protein NC181_03490 [Clostridium sp.]|nr:hypothetical protein [Clostridium sp.]MCM1444424.1 hypothetical protein [Candidatus Amulumruptor caecigallinarius]